MIFEFRDKSSLVQELFNKIAPVYDLLNDIMSLGQHKRWKGLAVEMLHIQNGNDILDLCCGSGDITRLILDKYPENIYIKSVDFSDNMLKIARKKLAGFDQVEILQADAMRLPFENNSFDRIIISFGLRNLKNIDDALTEISRILKKEGKLVVIDFGKPESLLFKMLFNLYFDIFVPVLGKIFKNHAEYSYLPASIKEYPSPASLMNKMKEAGFSKTFNKNLFMGFVAIQNAIK